MYRTEIYVWSIREDGYCDELVHVWVETSSPEAARDLARQMIRDTPHGHYAHYNLPDHPNRNIRAGWTHAR